MKKLLTDILSHVVEHPSDVNLTEVQGAKTLVYELKCNAEDVGKVIGKQGKTVGAIRNLLTALSGRDGKRTVLEVIE